jgi:hypothetical protein
VIRTLQHLIDIVDPGALIIWGWEGPMSHEVAVRGIDLLGQEVIPAIKACQSNREKGNWQVAHSSVSGPH